MPLGDISLLEALLRNLFLHRLYGLLSMEGPIGAVTPWHKHAWAKAMLSLVLADAMASYTFLGNDALVPCVYTL